VARTAQYRHYCPVARALEVIGEKWSLLIVRDLLRGPQRFSDLLRYLEPITPKWLTLRLRELEAAGIVAREHAAGRREVWYRLTPRGRDLAPVVGALATWGIEHALRPPLPDEPIHAAQMTGAMAAYFNARRVTLPRPARWLVCTPPERPFTFRFDGERWLVQRGDEPADVQVEATPRGWVTFLTAAPAQRSRSLADLHLAGPPDRVAEFLTVFGLEAAAPPPADRADGGVAHPPDGSARA
jgi:DNA-binding HxlR family transcriptional regulator